MSSDNHQKPAFSPNGHVQPGDGQDLPGASGCAMWLFIIALSMLFAATLVGFIVIRAQAEVWPPPGVPPIPSTLWISTLLILGSSATMFAAVHGIRSGNSKQLAQWLGATMLLAMAFVILQFFNWLEMIPDQAVFGTKAVQYPAMFWVLTGLHAAHVFGGVVPMAFITGAAFRGLYSRDSHDPVTRIGMYWHFLGITWIAIFIVLKALG